MELLGGRKRKPKRGTRAYFAVIDGINRMALKAKAGTAARRLAAQWTFVGENE